MEVSQAGPAGGTPMGPLGVPQPGFQAGARLWELLPPRGAAVSSGWPGSLGLPQGTGTEIKV